MRPPIVAGLIALFLISAASASGQSVEWPVHGGDPGGMKYSALTDINRSNVTKLEAFTGRQ